MIKQIAIMGASGQVGKHITQNLLESGHSVKIITHRKDCETADLVGGFMLQGAEFVLVEDTSNEEAMVEVLKGYDTFVAAVPGSEKIITQLQPIWLEAAKKAGVKRFIPTEFGAHTRNIEYGDGVLFDYKKDFHKKLFESGLEWTLIYNGIIHDYALPNLRFFEDVTTFGNIELPIYTHSIEDIGKHAALALTDERTINRCVQMDYQSITQADMIDLIKKHWSDEPLVFKHYSTKYIEFMKENSGNDISAKAGAETDKERWGINNVVYVLGKLHAFTDETLKASELWSDIETKSPEESIEDPEFFFETEIVHKNAPCSEQ